MLIDHTVLLILFFIILHTLESINFLEKFIVPPRGKNSVNAYSLYLVLDLIFNVALNVVSNIFSRYLHGFNYFYDTASILPYGTIFL